MLENEVTPLDFPIEQDLPLPMTRKGWRQVGSKWVMYERPYPPSRSQGQGIPLKRRMRTLANCTMCHVGTIVVYDHFGETKGRLSERLCKDCYGTYVRSGYSSEYQNRIDDSVAQVVGFQEYQQERRNEPTGPQRLAAAIIASAAQDLWRETTYTGKPKERAETKEWLQGAPAKVTFQWCCEVLNLDPEWTRHMVYASRERYQTQETKRTYAGFAFHPVEEYVPDADGSERSNPLRIRKRAADTARQLRLAVQAIATYTG